MFAPAPAGQTPAATASRPAADAQQARANEDVLGRARLLWPRLPAPRDAAARHDPRRMAHHVSRRTSLPLETILALLERP